MSVEAPRARGMLLTDSRSATRHGQGRRQPIGPLFTRALVYLALVAIAVFTVGPYYWMLKTSLETSANVYAFPPTWIPNPVSLDAFVTVWTSLNVYRYFFNSTIITVSGIFFSVLFAALFAYPLARYRFPGRNAIFMLVLIPMMIPLQSAFIVNFLTIRGLGMVNTFPGVILPQTIALFGVFLLRQAYLNIPRDFEDAGRIDGASEFYIWSRIMLPMVKPAVATLVLLQFLSFWNEFVWPLVVLRDPDMYPLSVGLLYLNNTFQTSFRNVAAGAVIATAPVVMLLFAMQRQFVRGLTSGGVKY